MFLIQTQLQQISVEEYVLGEFALVTLTFGSCTYPTDTFPSPNYLLLCHFLSNIPSTAAPFAQKTISNASNALSISTIILDEEVVPPIFESHICFRLLLF